MDRARDYHFVEQLPRRTAAEVDRQDATYDRQVLLNESWSHYCQRLHRSAAVAAEDRSKWETETWAEYEQRVITRTAYLKEYAARQAAEAAAYAQREAATSAKAAAKVKQLAAVDEHRVATTRLGPQHSLLLDFDDLRAERERRERLDKETEETASRAHILRQEAEDYASIMRQFADELNALLEALEARRLAAEAEAQRQREERMKREQAAREAEERRRKEAEEAEKRRREAEEEAKRAERRRKDEERRLKAKADRDAARGAKGGDALNATTNLDATTTSVSSPHEDFTQVKAARDARERRVLAELDPFLHKFVAACGAIAKEAAGNVETAAGKLDSLLRGFVEDTGAGRLLFHTAVYIGLSDETLALLDQNATPITTPVATAAGGAAGETTHHAKLHYRYASENCNAELRSGRVSFDLNRHAHAPTVAHCIKAAEVTPIIELGGESAAHLVRLDAASPPAAHATPLGDGYFFASPVTAAATPHHVYGCISIDTASVATARDPEVTLQPAETKVYTATGALAAVVSLKSFDETTNGENQSFALAGSSTSVAGRGTGAVAIFPQTQQFIIDCSRALGDALAAIATARKAAAVPVLTLDSSATTSLPALYAGVCRAIQAYFKPRLVDVYVSRFAKVGAPDATIVCHNGVCAGDVAAGTDPLLGQSISRPATATDAKKGGGSVLPPTFALQAAKTSSGILTPDVSDSASGCMSYRGVPPPHGEALFVVPLQDEHDHVAAVIGISCAAADGGAAAFTDAVRASLEGFCAGPVRDAFAVLLQHQIQAALCEQAVDWMCMTTGATNAYLALSEGDKLRIVAASESQAFLKGKSWGPADGGVTLPWLRKAVPPGSTTAPAAIDDLLLHVKKLKESAPQVKLFRDGLQHSDIAADAEMFAAVVTTRHNVGANAALGNAPAYGVLVVDSVVAPGSANAGGSKKANNNTFTDADKEMLRTTAFLLAEALSGSHLHEGHALAVDAVIDPDRLAFLKRVYSKVSTDVKNITANQLSEMSRYNNPPEVIPKVCSATFIATGVKPSTVAAWDDIRKRLTQALLEKMGAYDPTSLKVKKAFFTRAKKLTAGLTAAEVFARGSYPASCFFAWTFATVLLRKAADNLRRRAKAGLLDAASTDAQGHDDDDQTSTSATEGAAGDAADDGETDEE